jgi:V8-like Glu-specific endopeptidase
LIWKVLAQPCGIEVTSEDQAEELFRQLKREVALVTSEPDGSLRQRQELRILMLDLLRSDNPEKVRRIHEAAVSYYQPRPLLAAERAEEIYHRLQLDQEPGVIDARWVDGLERYLASAFEEFSGRRLAYLATRLGVDVDDETRQLADLEDWEKITARDVQALFAQNQTAQALQLMRVRTERSTVSPLIALEARALALQANWNDALSVLDSGFQRAASEGERSRALALALQAAEVVLSARLEAEARAAFERLTGANADTLSNVQQFEATVRQLALIRLDRELTAESSGLNERFRTLFDSFPDDVLGQNPGLCYWAATVFETTDAARLARVIVLCGLPQGHELETRQIASELTSFDAALSRDFGETPGILAREAGIPLQSSLTATWSEFLLKGDSSKVRDALSGLLLKHASFTPGRLIEAFAQLMLVSLGVRRQVVARPAEAKATSALNKPTMKRLQDALISAFEPNEFAAFLRIRLDRNVEAISTLQQPFNFIVSRVIEVANAEGWVFELITQASYAKPRNQNIAAVAADVGLASSPSEPALERIVRNSAFHDVHAFSSRLSQISAAICRVEVGDVLGTGFLVGVDLLLTADFVMSKLLEKAVPLSAVNFRFDYKGDNENRLTRGTLFGLAEDWLVARDPYRSADDGLGYVLLRLAGSPGAQPIGSERAESSEQLRQWLSVPDPSSLPHHGEQLLIAGHPAGRPLQISFGQAAAASPDARLRYTVDTAAGSSGAPCFTGSLELAGMHLGKEPYTGANFNFGVSMMAIVADLDRKGLGQLLRTQFL